MTSSDREVTDQRLQPLGSEVPPRSFGAELTSPRALADPALVPRQVCSQEPDSSVSCFDSRAARYVPAEPSLEI